MLLSPMSLFTIGHGDEVTVNVLNVKGVITPGGMIKMCLGQVSVWNFPYGEIPNGQLSNRAELFKSSLQLG